ncbi:MAG TPA: sulfotransferase [Candidatus Paceibacterota bacterium]|nr:sulfotransferase [Candidatus Paceibacterota bacterium]
MARGPQQISSLAHDVRLEARSWLAKARPLPSFMIIGAQRAGSTTFYGNIAQHPQIEPPIRKEIHYFSVHFQRGISWYRAHFPLSIVPAPKWQTFEATPYYLFHPLAPSRIQAVLPSARFIVILRDPVDRAVSHYRLNLERGNEELSFDEAIQAEPQRVPLSIDNLPSGSAQLEHHRRYSYLARGRYVEQLERWFSLFDRSRFHIVDFADLANDLRKSIGDAFAFLELPDFKGSAPRRRGMTTSHVSRPVDGADRLSEYFRPHNENLFKLLGRRFDWK